MGRDVGFGAFHEPRGGFFAFVAEDLRVRQSAVIVDGVMGVRATPALFRVVAVADRATNLAMPTAVGNTAELLDVDVDQIPRSRVLVAARLRASHPEFGVQIEVAQKRYLVSA